MNDGIRYSVQDARWPEVRARIRHVREIVFVREQAVPVEIEWDGLDGECMHVLVETSDGEAIGTGRLQPDGKIGRMAVLKPFRGMGVGTAMLKRLLQRARHAGMRRCYLHAQTHALEFYARHGFVARGPEFDEAGIPHREMGLEFADD